MMLACGLGLTSTSVALGLIFKEDKADIRVLDEIEADTGKELDVGDDEGDGDAELSSSLDNPESSLPEGRPDTGGTVVAGGGACRLCSLRTSGSLLYRK